jgi:imidazole glycerol-phosphate synthase subunit HisH
MIAIIDYGAGNLKSVKKAFDYLDANVVVTDQPESIAAADKIVLPGVGHFSSLQALSSGGLGQLLIKSISEGKPFLGICLGMQWLFEGSEECTDIAGAGILPGKCQRFASNLKSPHVGWNSIEVRGDPRLFRGVAQNSFVYYTHSFHAPATSETSAASEYGITFAAAVERDNIFGVQFHPEKSGDVGLAVLTSFCEA